MPCQNDFVEEPDEFAKQLSDAKSGSKEEQAALLETFRNYLRKIASETIAKDPQAQLSISDLVQSAIIDAHEGFGGCRAKSHVEFKAWLKRILMNDILNRYRDLTRKKRDVRKEKPIDDQPISADDDTPSQQFVRDEEEQRLLKAICQLPREQQKVIRMRHHKNLTFAAIADELGKSPDATRTLWNKAIEALSKILANTQS